MSRYNNEEDLSVDHYIEDVYGEDLDPNRRSRIIRSKVIKRKHVVAEPNQDSVF